MKGAVSKEQPWPGRLVVRDRGAVELLTDLKAVRYLAPFLRRPHTLSSAAAVLGIVPSTLAYWLPRFVREGLLVELDPVARAGMPMRRYRATARELLVPLAAMPLDRRVALLDAGRLRLLRRFLDGLDEVLAGKGLGGLVFRASSDDTDTGVAITVDEPEAARDWFDAWMTAPLTAAQAKAFARDLEMLVEKYSTGTTGRMYQIHLGFAPEPRHPWRSAEDQLPR